MKKIRNNKGVTLIELILVLAIMSIVLQVVYSLFFVGNKSLNISKVQGFLQQDARIAENFITQELRSAKEISKIKLGPEPYYSISFDGNKLIRKSFNGAVEPEKPLYLPLLGIKVNHNEADTNGIIKVTILSKEKGQDYNLEFSIILENLPNYKENINQDIIYYTKYE